jgi:hypothetical protein
MATSAQDILDALEATILKLASGANQTVNFNGQSFTQKDMKSLTEQRTYWKAQLLREQAATSTAPQQRFQIGFVPSRRVCPLP